MKVGQYTIETSNEDKVLFPDADITKGDLISYYHDVADYMLPHLKDRPVNMQRFPDGIGKEGFYQKDASDYFPDWVDTVEVKKEGGTVQHVLINKKATLVYLANQACITPHIWLCKNDKIMMPDRLIFDLDPPEGKFDLVIQGAKDFRKVLEEELGLNVYLMTTGSKGLHVVAPLTRDRDFDDARSFARELATCLANRKPDDYTVEVRKNKRKGRLFLDYLRNAYAQTGVAPYAVRPREGAPIATPLEWDELDDKNLTANKYTIRNIEKRLNEKGDIWKGINQHGRSLKRASKKLQALLKE